MNTNYQRISELLLNCEKNGYAPAYAVNPDTYKEQRTAFFQPSLPVRTKPVIYSSEGEEIFVVSDLHIASGRNRAGVYQGTENFFADECFYRFITYADGIKKTPRAILIINGDIFDFLRITDYPGKVKKVRPVKKLKRLIKFDPVAPAKEPSKQQVNNEYSNWSDELKKVGINKNEKELENSISDREKTYGLHTDDYKTIYRLNKIRKGHPAFFKALSYWLENGNKIIVIKGNHDVELYWLAVRNYLRLIFAEGFENKTVSIEDILKDIVLPNVTFIDDSIEIDKDFYIEHGHRYDKFSMVLDNPYLEKRPKEINIPFGSFINRYLLNRVELFLPFLDNVKPTANILPLLIRENFPLAVKVFFQHIPLTLRIIGTNVRYTWFMFNRVFWFFIALVLPILALVWFNRNFFTGLAGEYTKLQEASDIFKFISGQAVTVISLVFSYFLSRFVAWLQITEPSSLNQYAEMRFNNTDYRIMTMGHTHNPGEYIFENNRRFYNTGTWIPIIETSNGDVREDKTYTFLHLERDLSGRLKPANDGLLQRWNDSAERAEPLVLIQKK